MISRSLRFLGLAALVTVSTLLGAATAAPVAPARAELAPAIALTYRAAHLQEAFRNGDAAAREAAIQEVELLRRTYGTLDVLPLVEAMAIAARDLGAQGKPEQGLQLVQALERWAPHNASLLGTKVVLTRQQGLQGYLWSIGDVLELARMRMAHPVHRWLFAVQHLAWLRLMATLLLWGWTLTLALRYRRVFRYPWEDALRSRGMNVHVLAVLGAFVITLPVILGLDPSLAAFGWLWLLAPFLLSMEVRVTFFVIALQLVHPALGALEPLAATHPEPTIVALQLRPQALPAEVQDLAVLPAGDRAFLMGWRHLQLQEWAQAESAFAALVGTHPDRAEVLNNLAVARFQQGNVAGAKARFDEAYLLAPANGEILLNQSVVAYKTMDSQLGAEKQAEAKRVAPEVFANLLGANQARSDQRTFGLPLPESPIRTVALRMAQERWRARSVDDGVKDKAILFSLAVTLLALVAFYQRLRRSLTAAHPSQCTRCGDPFHTTDSPDVYVCSRCHHLFVLKDGLHGESRKKKVDEVTSFQTAQRWLHRFLVVALPGADHIFLGDTWHGFVEYGFLCFAWGLVLATGRSVRYPGELLADPASTWLPLGLGLLALLLVRSWFKLLPRRS